MQILAVNPDNPAEYYVAVASGGVWKTTNGGTTYEPIFDGQGSYSIGCVEMAPSNNNVIWVGTGENNNQRSVAYGDGVYRSLDGGKSWKNMGLKSSEHIGQIAIHPANSNIVYVAAYGPLWSKGGERGLYKTVDGGENWELILEIDEHTGINEVILDFENPEVVYSAAHQRRRHVFTYVGGGPGSGIHKSIDGGKTWKKLSSGLPANMGRIGMAMSPADHNYLYAIIEAENGKGGTFRSTDRGESWSKMSSYVTSGNYYQELICDPHNKDKFFSMNTWLHHSVDGGKHVVATGETSKHVDNHCIWIDPLHTDHWLVGCDGGLYETWDHAKSWSYKPNLPVIQFYKVAVDNDVPFYNVYGGTQDNNSMGGPSRTINNHGILNSDWRITNGGDGFESAIDPKNPNIVYAQSQHGWLVRYDKASGESVGIKPVADKEGPALRWNWDAPLLISPHNNKRLYFAANALFRSDDRGDSWKRISGDLTQQIDRNQLKVMGQVLSTDVVMKNKSTTMYGNIVALDESPVQEGLVYVGTDDGLIQVTEDNGANWRKIASFPGVPKNTYVNAISCSKYDANVVFAVFNNHKQGDFKPYILKSFDKGATWTAIQSDLPERGSVYDVVQDHVDKDLLFCGTEFGCFFSQNGGEHWSQLKSGLPTIAVRDLEIQERENDLVLASFGRGFYILDDYSALRTKQAEIKGKSAYVFPVKDALMFVDARPLGLRGKGSQGENLYVAENPPIGAVFTYYLGDTLETAKQRRQRLEKKLRKEGNDIAYPTMDQLRNEDREESPYLIFSITDANGKEVRRIRSGVGRGVKRVVWDFYLTPQTPIKLKPRKPGRYGEAETGPLALPGKYAVEIFKVVGSEVTSISNKQEFVCKWLDHSTLPATDKAALLSFQNDVEELRKVVFAVQKVNSQYNEQLKYAKAAIVQTPGIEMALLKDVERIEESMYQINLKLNGDRSKSKRDIETKESVSGMVWDIVGNMWRARSAPSGLNKGLYNEASEMLGPLLEELTVQIGAIDKLKSQLDLKGVPYTPGRLPVWKAK